MLLAFYSLFALMCPSAFSVFIILFTLHDWSNGPHHAAAPMKVTELKEELAARDEALSGNKAWLRRRLHAAIVRAHVEARAEEESFNAFYFCDVCNGRVLAFYSDFADSALLAFYSENGLLLAYPGPMTNIPFPTNSRIPKYKLYKNNTLYRNWKYSKSVPY